MNDKSIEETKMKLIEAGYYWNPEMDNFNPMPSMRSPKGDKHRSFLGKDETEVVRNAYAHMQEQDELKDLRAENKELRAFVLESGHDWLDVYDPNIGEYVSAEADKLIDKYNITAEEGDADE